MSYMYEIPGAERFSGVTRMILGDWKLSGISTFATGGRGNVSVSYAPAFDNTGGGEGCTGRTATGNVTTLWVISCFRGASARSTDGSIPMPLSR